MKRSSLSLCIFLSAFSFTLPAQAYLPWVTPDAHGISMGYSGVAENPDANAMFWNASKLAFAEGKCGVSVSYQPWNRNYIPDGNFVSSAVFFRPDTLSALGVSVRYLNEGTRELMLSSGAIIGRFQPNESSVDLAYARRLGNALSASLTVRYSNANPDGLPNYRRVNYLSGDAGLFYKGKTFAFLSKKSSFTAGLSVTNIGHSIDYQVYNPDEHLPLTARAGGALLIAAGEQQSLAITGEFDYYANEVPRSCSAGGGVDYTIGNWLSLRGGYRYDWDWDYHLLTAGLGLHYQLFRLDFSYTHVSYDRAPLQNNLGFTFSANFGGKKPGD